MLIEHRNGIGEILLVHTLQFEQVVAQLAWDVFAIDDEGAAFEIRGLVSELRNLNVHPLTLEAECGKQLIHFLSVFSVSQILISRVRSLDEYAQKFILFLQHVHNFLNFMYRLVCHGASVQHF